MFTIKYFPYNSLFSPYATTPIVSLSYYATIMFTIFIIAIQVTSKTWIQVLIFFQPWLYETFTMSRATKPSRSHPNHKSRRRHFCGIPSTYLDCRLSLPPIDPAVTFIAKSHTPVIWYIFVEFHYIFVKFAFFTYTTIRKVVLWTWKNLSNLSNSDMVLHKTIGQRKATLLGCWRGQCWLFRSRRFQGKA